MQVAVFGELCTDRFVYSEIKRLSPEAPVPVLNPIETIENPGMAGNVVENLHAMNEDARVLHVWQDEEITKTRFIEKKSNHMFVRLDEGEGQISPLVFEDMPDQVVDFLHDADATIVSDYDKGFMDIKTICKIAKDSHVSVLDSKKKLSVEVVDAFTFIKLNEGEAEYNKKLVALYPEKFIVTLGAKGVYHNGKSYPSENPQETIDVSGAGDTFVAAFTLKFVETGDTSEAIRYGNEMAGMVVTKRGVAVPK
jgi:bifunctional ADP-heptose synthase (sugar kinase/adenylyltransferase)